MDCPEHDYDCSYDVGCRFCELDALADDTFADDALIQIEDLLVDALASKPLRSRPDSYAAENVRAALAVLDLLLSIVADDE